MPRVILSFLLICGSSLLWTAPETTFANTVRFFELRGSFTATDKFNFVFVDATGSVTTNSFADDDLDGLITVPIPATAIRGCEEQENGDDLCWRGRTIFAGFPKSGQVPLLVDSTGLSLLPEINTNDVGNVPALIPGQTIEVVNGVSASYAVATIHAPGVAFSSIPLQDFADINAFPLFTGTATVSSLLDLTVVVPEPSIFALTALGLLGLLSYGHPRVL